MTGLEYYDQEASAYFEKYESLYFSKIHRVFLPFLPKSGSLCLDVGAGSGRDAMALARRGYRVTAVEPSLQFRSMAITHNSHENIRWVDDCLPKLRSLSSDTHAFSFILLSAVWMHIAPFDRDESLATLSNLLAIDGKIALTLRIGPTDLAKGMHEVSVDDLILRASKYDLVPVYLGRSTSDALHRKDIKWKRVVLAHAT